MSMKAYPETHQQGTISFENIRAAIGELLGGADSSHRQGDLGIQIASDGRVWVCVNGVVFLRFSPHRGYETSKEATQWTG